VADSTRGLEIITMDRRRCHCYGCRARETQGDLQASPVGKLQPQGILDGLDIGLHRHRFFRFGLCCRHFAFCALPLGLRLRAGDVRQALRLCLA
jgi:hypothetical protein